MGDSMYPPLDIRITAINLAFQLNGYGTGANIDQVLRDAEAFLLFLEGDEVSEGDNGLGG